MTDRNSRLSQASTISNVDQVLDQYQYQIIDLCQAGDLDRLTKVDFTIFSDSIICDFFAAAAKHEQVAVINYLSDMSPSTKLDYSVRVAGFLTRDLTTIRALLSHDRSIANSEYGDKTNQLYEFCRGSDPALALLLLEFGADPQSHIRVYNPIDGALMAQPMILIKSLINSGAIINGITIRMAERYGRKDFLEYLEGLEENQGVGNNSASKRFFKKKDGGNRCIML